ncbi:MAG TPA: A/G-specific adenine glycosylase [Flavobacteriales bacterium]|jgi:A/G-specific adenine glycosylase|nr:A/G-specific adenine glycosylase [Flavobacteriales bacterium]HAW19726.1 A/G-specific adenine glycosylase [Flavobacteriales bacterium]
MSETHIISRILARWYETNKRDLPWRHTKNPYFIWLSEIILQQTRVEQGMPYYQKFVATYPTVRSLATAPEDDVLKLWQGLGYYSRARNLQFAAKQIMSEHGGQFPTNYAQIIGLKGIGIYTASAISSFAFGSKNAVVDGNVIRTLTRLFNISDPVNKRSVQIQIQALADTLLDTSDPGRHNQAMMEFGALHCAPRQPDCQNCPVQAHCASFAAGTVDQIPLKEKAKAKRDRHFHFAIVSDGASVCLEKRDSTDIWAGLHQFPLIETAHSDEVSNHEIAALIGIKDIQILKVHAHKKHVLSHQNIHSRFYHCSVPDMDNSKFSAIKLSEVHRFALPRLIDRYLENQDIF